MVRESHTTRALRDHAASLKAPSRQALRYLRSLIDKRPYTTLPVNHADLQELEELRQMGLWPPQTCNTVRKSRRKERECLDVCGISQREEKAESRVVPELHGRQPELRLDYEDASVIRRNQKRPVVEARAPHRRYIPIVSARSLHTKTILESRTIHTTSQRSNPSSLLSQSSAAQLNTGKTAKRKGNWQFVLATVGRQKVAAASKTESISRLYTSKISPIDEDNRLLEHRISKYLRTPARAVVIRGRDHPLRLRMKSLISHRRYDEAIKQFKSAWYKDVPIECVEMCVSAYLKLGQIALARAVMEKFKASYRPSKNMMHILLKTLLARCKVDAAVFFVRMARDTATGFSTLLTKTLLEGIRKIGVQLERLKEVFDYVESIVPKSQSMHYTILIRGCVEANNLELASQWLVKMREAGHTPDKWTYNVVLTGAAKVGEWKQIRPLLKLIHDRGFGVTTESMNLILNMAAESRSRSVKDMYELIRALGAAWDMATWNIMLKATIIKCPDKDIDHQVKAFFRKMRNAGVQPDTITANTLLTKIKHSGSTNPRVLRRLLVDICEKDNLVENKTREILRGNMLHHTSAKTTAPVIRKDADTLDSDGIELRMIACLRELKPVESLQIFQNLITQAIRPTARTLLLAMKSVFLLPVKPFFPRNLTGSEREQLKYEHLRMRSYTVENILQIAEDHGLDLSSSLSQDAREYLRAVYSYRLVKDHHTRIPQMLFTPNKDVLFELYAFYHKYDLPNPHYPLMITATNLFNHRQYEAMLELMRSVSLSEWGRRRPFDIVSLTIMLKAYIVLKDAMGVKWVAEHVVERKLEPDEIFIKILTGKKKVPAAPYTLDWDEGAREVVNESRRICVEMKERMNETKRRRKKMIVEILTDKVEDAGEEAEVPVEMNAELS